MGQFPQCDLLLLNNVSQLLFKEVAIPGILGFREVLQECHYTVGRHHGLIEAYVYEE